MTFDSGPIVELGEAQWALAQGYDRAHWFAIHPSRSTTVTTTCGIRLIRPVLHHPGTFPVCGACAGFHPLPGRSVGADISAWMSRRCAPHDADRRREP